jgi:hypothetical protein
MKYGRDGKITDWIGPCLVIERKYAGSYRLTDQGRAILNVLVRPPVSD